jgi:hypothetical protein
MKEALSRRSRALLNLSPPGYALGGPMSLHAFRSPSGNPDPQLVELAYERAPVDFVRPRAAIAPLRDIQSGLVLPLLDWIH